MTGNVLCYTIAFISCRQSASLPIESLRCHVFFTISEMIHFQAQTLRVKLSMYDTSFRFDAVILDILDAYCCIFDCILPEKDDWGLLKQFTHFC